MEIKIPKREERNVSKYFPEDIEIARKFCKKIYDEVGNFIKIAVVFGSAARIKERKEGGEAGDIDILLVIDDVTINLTPELIQTYRVLVEKMIADTSPRLHVTTLKLTSFWEYVRAGDPVAINILRDGVALIDSGFFDPLQVLLLRGKIRPTEEAMWGYFVRAPTTLHNSSWHVTQATIDLYWAVIDSAHAALMSLNVIPPSPSHVAELMEKELVPRGLNRKYVEIMNSFYNLYKKIIHRDIKEISGSDYDRYRKEADDFVNAMRSFVEKKR